MPPRDFDRARPLLFGLAAEEGSEVLNMRANRKGISVSQESGLGIWTRHSRHVAQITIISMVPRGGCRMRGS